ncbi:non-ribosomal peptide synthetase [Pyrenophora seminiperda CCB06]|uniref:Non-ribosomal peptide synthetase n=1 Tax=Pyrenophora seminiperda CCB06 TaxID=1302712 RepID=A0A3M7M631_9PLEO|nr:non-ribosomal peptide synthetase [Pyrenophora seminiperda CCB06]
MELSPNTGAKLTTSSVPVDHEDGKASSRPQDDQHLNLNDIYVNMHARQDTSDIWCESNKMQLLASFPIPDVRRPPQSHRSRGGLLSSSSSSLTVMVDEKENNKAGKSQTTLTLTQVASVSSLVSSNTSSRPWLQLLLIHWFSVYRILIGLVTMVNLVVLAVMIRKNMPYTRFSLAGPLIATAANIFAAVLMRQEEVINTMFRIFSLVPLSLPLWFRKTIADFHHFGGFHIGCAVSALLWYIFVVYLNTAFFVNGLRKVEANAWVWADVATCYSFLISIVLVCVAAHPRFRQRFHNTFERTHRFGGWIALIVLWINAGVSSRTHGSKPMYLNPAVWLLAVTTFLIILPWLRMNRVPITATAVSEREVRLSFPYKNMPFLATMRFSTAPLTEWHAFATVPEPETNSAYILISAAGDWTKKIIANPPKEIFLRHPATLNFLNFAPVFSSLLLVGTGAGIGPLLSLLKSPQMQAMRNSGQTVRVMWSAYNIYAPHWAFVLDIIRAVDPQPKLFDSTKGRADVTFETVYLMQRECLEAVMIVSNPLVTRQVVEGVKAKGLPAYGAVFDS